MGLLLVRYAELGLKGPGVRRFFEKVLVDNMMSVLVRDGMEALIDRQQGRIFVQLEDENRGIGSLRRVFGISSLSKVVETSSDRQEIRDTWARMSRDVLGEGSTFKVEARRQGTHPYTSMELARDVGESVLEGNPDLRLKVDLHHPEVRLYVEVRANRAYLFSKYIPGPGGLPMGTQGKVLVVVRDRKDLLAAWMMMKRGCRTILLSGDEESVGPLRAWDPEPRIISGTIEEGMARSKAIGLVLGHTLEDLEGAEPIECPVPIYYPLIGMDKEEVERRLKDILA